MFSGKPDGSEIDYDRRAVVTSWREKASACGGSFERFIYRWMSFNGWVACVTGEERDGVMLDEFTSDKPATATFDALIRDSMKFREAVTGFAKLWPIFNAAHVYNMGEKRPRAVSMDQRPGYVRALLANKEIWRRPRNWDPDAPPAPQLKDLFDAIYQVRCNLFHGDKVSYAEIDSKLIEHADTCLRLWLDESRCYAWPLKAAA